MNRKSFLGLVLWVAGAAWAAPASLQAAEARGLRLTRPMVISGIYLRAADYLVQWDLHGTHATVTFTRKGRTVATVQGELMMLDRSTPNDTCYFSRQPDGFFAINALGFAKSDQAVVFPVRRSHRNPALTNPAASVMMENEWRNRGQPAPMVYK